MDFLGLRTLTLIDNCVEDDRGARRAIDARPRRASRSTTRRPTSSSPDGPDLAASSSSSRTACATSCGASSRDRLERPDRAERALPARPARSGMIDDFIKRKHGQTRGRATSCPQLEPILTETYGVIVYQEQVMQIASALAGFTLGEADILRKAMGKKKAEVMATQMRASSWRAAPRSGVAEKKAAQDLRPDGAVRRLRLQQVALGRLRLARLPDRLPEGELPGATSWRRCSPRSARTPTRWSQYIGECREMGIQVLPPDVNESASCASRSEPARASASAWPRSRTSARARSRRCSRRGGRAAPSARSSTSATASTCAP